jgi:hypothetical protein
VLDDTDAGDVSPLPLLGGAGGGVVDARLLRLQR